jgi:hypothetical protein
MQGRKTGPIDRLMKVSSGLNAATRDAGSLENSAQELSLLLDGVDFTPTPRSPMFHPHAAPSCG